MIGYIAVALNQIKTDDDDDDDDEIHTYIKLLLV